MNVRWTAAPRLKTPRPAVPVIVACWVPPVELPIPCTKKFPFNVNVPAPRRIVACEFEFEAVLYICNAPVVWFVPLMSKTEGNAVLLM